MRRQQGFTLIELITVIILLGIVGVGVASFMRGAIQIFVDVNEREQLLTESRFAIERLKRELANAVPNSFRLAGTGTIHCLEFVPMNWSSVYTRLPTRNADVLTAELLFPRDSDNAVYAVTTDNDLVVYPLQSADVYDRANNKRQPVTSCRDDGDGDCSTWEAGSSKIYVGVANRFATESPSSRAYIVDRSVNYCVKEQQLIRFENAIGLTQSLNPVNYSVMAEHVVNVLSPNVALAPSIDDPFRVFDASRQRNSSVQIRLRFNNNDEQIAFQHEVHVANAP